MKVKIGNKIYDAEEQPIMIIFENDKEKLSVVNNLSNMAEKDGIRKYVTFPNTMKSEEVREFMKIQEDES